MSVMLRYTGPQPVSFLTGGVGHVGPGGEFAVADDLAEQFLRRGDVELATPGTHEDAAQDESSTAAAEPGNETPAGPLPASAPVPLQRAE